jgi:peptide/nickel transport system substrate-binding protein
MIRRTLALSAALLASAALAQATLRIGLAEDPDVLDPDLGRTYVGRIVFASLCDKLFEVTPDAGIIPMLATQAVTAADGLTLTLTIREGVVFHDGTALDAEAVAFNLRRSLELPGSNRRSEIAQVTSVAVTGPFEVTLSLSQPFAPLIAQLADRAGMMVSPTAVAAAGENFGAAPVCAGPFRFVERIAQDRIVVERFPDYYDADRIHLDRVVYLPIPDTSVRLANLQSGDLHLIERPAPSDLPIVTADRNLTYDSAPSLGYQGLSINIANPAPRDHPLADPRVREALELSLDRNVINQVVFDGAFIPGNQAVPPTSPWYVREWPMLGRDVERARALLAEAGHARVAFELMVANNPQGVRIGEVIQVLAGEAGFDVTIRATEFASALTLQEQGEFDVFQVGWSGRLDPDGNIHQYQTCEGTLNETGYCDPETDALLNAARAEADSDARYALYRDAGLRYLPSRHNIYLYHQVLFFPRANAVQGFVAYPDGLIRLQGVRID